MQSLIASTALSLVLAGAALAQDQEPPAGDPPAEAPPPPAEAPEAPPAELPGDQPEDVPAEQPPVEEPGEQPPAEPGEQPPAEAGEQPPAEAGEQPPAEAAEEPPAAAVEEAEPLGGAGTGTGGIGETFFVRTPQEYHMLASDLPGEPVFLDTTARVDAITAAEPAETGNGVDAEIRDGVRPLGTIADVLLDRAGGVAALVIELDGEMSGGGREVAVATGLVRMLPGSEDPAETVILLSLDALDVENAPDFARASAED